MEQGGGRQAYQEAVDELLCGADETGKRVALLLPELLVLAFGAIPMGRTSYSICKTRNNRRVKKKGRTV